MTNTSTTVVPMPQLVDLALSAPEVGVVNFTILHSLLHVLINQLELGDCNVEFRGADSERLQNYMSSTKPGPKIVLTEYSVGADGKQKKKGTTGTGRRGSKTGKDVKPTKEDSALKTEPSQTIVVVEKASKESNEPPQYTIALTKEQMSKMQADMKKLQNQVKELTDLPANQGIISAMRTQADAEPKPVLEMFQILNLVKRLDATEEALQKVASMLEDLAKETANIACMDKTIKTEGGNMKQASDGALAVVSKAQELRDSISSKGYPSLEDLERRVTDLEQILDDFKTSGGKISKSSSVVDTKKKKKKQRSKTSVIEEGDEGKAAVETEKKSGSKESLSVDINTLSTQEALAVFQKQLKALRESVEDGKAISIKAIKDIEVFKDAMQTNTDNLPPDMKVAQLDLKINNIVEQMNVMNNMIGQQFGLVQAKFGETNNEISSLWEKINSGDFHDPNAADRNNSFVDLYNKLVQLRSDMDDINEVAQKLLADREKKQGTLDVIIEQIEMLKTSKADREDLEDALADKADACQINRKVSYDQFDAAYDDITRQLTETLEKLSKQEDLWSQALGDVQREIGNKLDKMELSPLKDFINMKLKNIQEKFKKISAMKKEHEAAGSKSKYLRNVNCISCDSPVIMKKDMDSSLYPRPYAVPPNKSMAPYLAYELDQLRKQAKSFPNKNMNMFEGAIHYGKQKPTEKDHICNRYCGGSHTVTTPQQRVTRIGHFMEQWGPEITPVEDVLIKGTDGQLYRGNADAVMKQKFSGKPSVDATPVEKPVEIPSPTKLERAVSVPVASIDRTATMSMIPLKDTSAPTLAEEAPRASDSPPPPSEVESQAPPAPSAVNITSAEPKRSETRVSASNLKRDSAAPTEVAASPSAERQRSGSNVAQRSSLQKERTDSTVAQKAPSAANVVEEPPPAAEEPAQ